MTERDHSKPEAEAPQRRSRWLAQHFDTPQQQFHSAKLGMWIFLLTEILFFGGLFCAYAVYRRHHPEVFLDGHHFLDMTYGAVNTGVLIFSSLTMAWAVRSAQLSRRRELVFLLAVTLACALVFLGIKYVEYKQKWDHRMVPGQAKLEYWFSAEHVKSLFSTEPSPVPDRGFKADTHYVKEHLAGAGYADLSEEELDRRVENLGNFFGIYFALTGLHAIHVMAGIVVILWIVVRSLKGHFSSEYFEPVDCVGLYWHLVDMIWIYLFPLLYLIH